MITQPLNIALKKHQLESIEKMETLENSKYLEDINLHVKFGINCDHTNSGKTLSMIGLIKRDRMEWDLTVPYCDDIVEACLGGLGKKISIFRYTKLPTTLIIVNKKLLSHWLNEFHHTDLRLNTVRNVLESHKVIPSEYDVILVSSNIYTYFNTIHSNKAWKRVIIDEPNDVRITGSLTVKNSFLWFISSRPNELISSKKNYITDIIGNNWDTFKKEYQTLLIKTRDDVVLEDQNTYTEITYKCSMSMSEMENIVIHNGGSSINIDESNYITDICNICLETNIKDTVVEPTCSKSFCGKCMLTWLSNNNTCPTCRCSTYISNLVYIKSDSIYNTKDFVLKNIIKHTDKNIIISSNFTNIYPTFLEENISFTHNLNVRKFKEGEYNSILIDTDSNKNLDKILEYCNNIIFYHDISNNYKEHILSKISNKKITCHYLSY